MLAEEAEQSTLQPEITYVKFENKKEQEELELAWKAPLREYGEIWCI